MYICVKCGVVRSAPGTCPTCGIPLQPYNSSSSPSSPSSAVSPLPQRRFILFVGAIDGVPEIAFLGHLRPANCTAMITSYEEASDELMALNGKDYQGVRLAAQGNVDATQLLATWPARGGTFDVIVWIGPTNDDDLKQTSTLVGLFVKSAAKVLKPGGVIFVVQDLKTPNFRNILCLPGAYFCCVMSLPSRTKTQKSAKKEVMEGRNDQLIAFTSLDGEICLHNDMGNADFIQMLTMIMSANKALFEMPAHLKKYNPDILTKLQIAELIFAYANNVSDVGAGTSASSSAMPVYRPAIGSSISNTVPPPQRQYGNCAYCGKQARLMCGRCKQNYYCDTTCQRAHWAVHKLTCKAPV